MGCLDGLNIICFYCIMARITIFLDNSLNSPDNNPPGFDQWVVGSSDVNANPAGVPVYKLDTNVSYTIASSTECLITWHSSDGNLWNSGPYIFGPFLDGQKIQLVKIVVFIQCERILQNFATLIKC